MFSTSAWRLQGGGISSDPSTNAIQQMSSNVVCCFSLFSCFGHSCLRLPLVVRDRSSAKPRLFCKYVDFLADLVAVWLTKSVYCINDVWKIRNQFLQGFFFSRLSSLVLRMDEAYFQHGVLPYFLEQAVWTCWRWCNRKMGKLRILNGTKRFICHAVVVQVMYKQVLLCNQWLHVVVAQC